MVVFLKSGGELRERLHPDVDEYTRRVEVAEGCSVAQILTQLGIDAALVAFVYAEGQVRRLDYIPRDGETVTLQQPVLGG